MAVGASAHVVVIRILRQAAIVERPCKVINSILLILDRLCHHLKKKMQVYSTLNHNDKKRKNIYMAKLSTD